MTAMTGMMIVLGGAVIGVFLAGVISVLTGNVPFWVSEWKWWPK